MYNKETEPCSAKAKCDFRSFRAVETFWTKQQSFISKKVGHQKWSPFFNFVCFSRCNFTKSAPSQHVPFQVKLKPIFNFSFYASLVIYSIVIYLTYWQNIGFSKAHPVHLNLPPLIQTSYKAGLAESLCTHFLSLNFVSCRFCPPTFQGLTSDLHTQF